MAESLYTSQWATLSPIIAHTYGDLDPHLIRNSLGQSETINPNGISCFRYYHLRRIWQIRKYVDDEAVRSLEHTFVISHLDYCNSLYVNSSLSTRQRLQCVQNCATHLVADARCASTRLFLQQLHWLPVEARIMYKVCTLTYCGFNGRAPQYLAGLCQVCSDDRLQAALRQDYVVPRTYTGLADSSFSVAGPTAGYGIARI